MQRLPAPEYLENMSLVGLCVCLSVHDFLGHQKSHLHDISAQSVIWVNLKHDDAWFLKFLIFTDSRGNFRVFQKIVFFVCFFSKISAILPPRTLIFWHKDYFYIQKMAFPEKFKFWGGIFRVLFSQFQKRCVCSWFPKPSNNRAAWNLSKHFQN